MVHLVSNSATPGSRDARQSILDNGQRLMASKGFTAVGLTEILAAAGVPKGSFYHYFGSKDAFGEALLERYFADYLTELDETFRQPGVTMAQRLLNHWQHWRENQSSFNYEGKCLAVKLGAEVADLSETMRSALERGTSVIIERLRWAVSAGIADGSLSIGDSPVNSARSLYQLWLGASVMAKIVRTTEPFDTAMLTTRNLLHLT